MPGLFSIVEALFHGGQREELPGLCRWDMLETHQQYSALLLYWFCELIDVDIAAVDSHRTAYVYSFLFFYLYILATLAGAQQPQPIWPI